MPEGFYRMGFGDKAIGFVIVVVLFLVGVVWAWRMRDN